MPKVSVIVPVYNVKTSLEKCLDSIVNQTLKDIEIIVVDDGSTDGSAVICDEYAKKDERIKVIHQQNGGLGKAYNTGVKAAVGEYIGFVESDDYAELNMFESLYARAKKDDSDIVKSNWYNWISKSNKNTIYDFIKKDCITNAQKNPEILQIQPSIWSAIYRRNFINENDICFLETSGASYQDTSFAFKTAACADKVSLTSLAYIHYCIDNENSSVKAKDKVFAICTEYDEIERFLKDKNINDKNILDFKLIDQWYSYLWNLGRVAVEFKNEFIGKFVDDFYNYYSNNQLSLEFMNKMNMEDKNIFKSKENLKNYVIQKIKQIENNNCEKTLNFDSNVLYTNIFQRLFSVKNFGAGIEKYKVLTILGIKIKTKIKRERITKKGL